MKVVSSNESPKCSFILIYRIRKNFDQETFFGGERALNKFSPMTN